MNKENNLLKAGKSRREPKTDGKSDFIGRLERLAAQYGVSCDELIAAGLKSYLTRENDKNKGKES